MKFLYLLIDLFTVIIPLLFSFHPKINFYKEWKWFIPANFITAILFIIWDIVFTKQGVWGFNEKYITGIYFYKLPLEELLFFFCIPYACVFTYYCINRFYKIEWTSTFERYFILVFSGLLLMIGVYFYSRSYTSVTFLSLSLILLIIKFIFKIQWLGKLLSIYPFLLIPFFIVNGILTGTGLEQPAVWYNDAENMGLRLLTIPVEDIFYGFELILLNIFFYNLFRSASRVHIAL
jgi:lycopene cyclase domain-containing protein